MSRQSRFATACLLLVVAALPARTAGQNLVAHWCFEEREGLVARDHIGDLEADLIDFDPLAGWVPGGAGLAALRFDGEDGHLVVGGEPLDLGADFTWAALIRTENPNAGAIISRSPTDDDWGMGSIALFVREGLLVCDVGYVGDLESGAPVDDGEWRFVAMTVTFNVNEEGGDLVQLYIDGFPDASLEDWDIEEFGPPGGEDDLKIGFASHDFPEDGTFFDGLIDDVRMWDGALSAEEVEAAFDEVGEGCPENPPVCDDPPDTHCRSLAVAGPDGGIAGLWTFTADTHDDGGDDPLLHHFTFDNGVDEPMMRTTTENEVSVRLRAGTWQASVTVDDDPWCDDEAGDAACAVDAIEVLPPPPQLVAHYCMEEREGNVVRDATGNADGRVVALDDGEIVEHEAADGIWAPGCFGTSGISPGNIEGFVHIEDPEGRIDLSENFTIAATIRTEEESAGTIFAQSPSEDVEPGAHHFFVEGGILFYDFGFIGDHVSTNAVNDGECHRVVVVVERDAVDVVDIVRFYIDGAFDSELGALDIHAAGDEIPGEKKIGMGAMYFPEQPLFQGVIDNLKIWNYALTPGEVEVDFDIEEDGCESNPLECPEAGDPEHGDTHCLSLAAVESPAGDLEGIWGIEVESADGGDDTIFHTLHLAVTTEDGDEEFDVTQFEEPFFELDLWAGEWTITASVDDDLFCDDEAADATCDPLTFTVNPVPEDLVASFCFEDDDPDFTVDAVGGIVADLFAFPEDVGDGEGPTRVEGLDEGSETALSFDGVDDVMAVDPHSAFDVSRSYTIAATIQVGADPDSGEPDPYAGNIWMLGPELGESGDTPGVQNLFVHEGFVQFTVLFIGEMAPFGAPVNDGAAHRVILSVDADFEGELDIARLFIDGLPAGEWEDDFQAEGVPEEVFLRVGYGAPDWPSADFPAENDRDINHFNGVIDNVKVWSFALDEEQVLEDFAEATADCEPVGPVFERGDTNSDGTINIADPQFSLNYQFLGGPRPSCLAAADTNADGTVNIADPQYSLNYQFLGGPAPSAPFPDCGAGDEGDAALGCDEPSVECSP